MSMQSRNNRVSFNFAQNNIFIVPNYRNIASDFINYYYNTYDNYFYDISELYTSNPSITFIDNYTTNFNELVRILATTYNINSFHHTNINFEAQPMGDNILIEIVGNVLVNNAFTHRFTETIVLVKSGSTNYHISNSIKKIFR